MTGLAFAFIFVCGFALGLIVPRDIAPMRRFSAWLMRHHDNRALAITVIAIAFAVLMLMLTGCGLMGTVKPQKGGTAATTLGGAAPTVATFSQPENPGTPATQQLTRDETRQQVVPVPVARVTETPQPDGTVVKVTEQYAPQILTSTTKEQSRTEVGAAQKDNARETAAKLAAMRPVQFAGIAALALACAMFHPVVRVALGGGKMLQVYVAAAGIILIFGPSLVAGNETLILIGAVVLGAAVWGINRLGHKEGQLDALARK